MFRENQHQTNKLAAWNTASSTNMSITEHLGLFYHDSWVDAGHPTVAQFKSKQKMESEPCSSPQPLTSTFSSTNSKGLSTRWHRIGRQDWKLPSWHLNTLDISPVPCFQKSYPNKSPTPFSDRQSLQRGHPAWQLIEQISSRMIMWAWDWSILVCDQEQHAHPAGGGKARRKEREWAMDHQFWGNYCVSTSSEMFPPTRFSVILCIYNNIKEHHLLSYGTLKLAGLWLTRR